MGGGAKKRGEEGCLFILSMVLSLFEGLSRMGGLKRGGRVLISFCKMPACYLYHSFFSYFNLWSVILVIIIYYDSYCLQVTVIFLPKLASSLWIYAGIDMVKSTGNAVCCLLFWLWRKRGGEVRGLIEDLWHLKVNLKVKKELSLPNNSLNSEICIKRKE